MLRNIAVNPVNFLLPFCCSLCFFLSPVQNRVLLERLSHMEVRLNASEEDSDRLRLERQRLRDRLSELQMTLREKEAEVKISDWPASADITLKDES